jgi:hypothetical protein
VPAGSVYAFLAEHRAAVFPDDLFADLFASARGRPSVPGPVIASVLGRVRGFHRQFNTARIRSFVSVFVERLVRRSIDQPSAGAPRAVAAGTRG